jgi:hypothetical protein
MDLIISVHISAVAIHMVALMYTFRMKLCHQNITNHPIAHVCLQTLAQNK